MRFRCPSRIHGDLDSETLKVKCASAHCGAGRGVVVFHLFNINTGELVSTERYQDPAKKFKTESTPLREGVGACR